VKARYLLLGFIRKSKPLEKKKKKEYFFHTSANHEYFFRPDAVALYSPLPIELVSRSMLCPVADPFLLLIPEFQRLTHRTDTLDRFSAFQQPGIVVPFNLLTWKGGVNHV
jgi:hypothetical protein